MLLSSRYDRISVFVSFASVSHPIRPGGQKPCVFRSRSLRAVFIMLIPVPVDLYQSNLIGCRFPCFHLNGQKAPCLFSHMTQEKNIHLSFQVSACISSYTVLQGFPLCHDLLSVLRDNNAQITKPELIKLLIKLLIRLEMKQLLLELYM